MLDGALLTDVEISERDSAIYTAALAGATWTEQAIAGLTALPAGLRGPGKTFTYLLTSRRSFLCEPPLPVDWSRVFHRAVARGVLELTGTAVRITPRAGKPSKHYSPEYRKAGPGLPPLLRPEDVVPLLEKVAREWPSVEALDKLQIAIDHLKGCR